jgi:hypothetical protein
VLPLLTLLHVSAEGRNAGENRDDEEEDGERPEHEELDDGEPEGGSRERSDGRGDEGP